MPLPISAAKTQEFEILFVYRFSFCSHFQNGTVNLVSTGLVKSLRLLKSNRRFVECVQEGAGSQAFLRSLYQAAWLQRRDASSGLARQKTDEKLPLSIQSLQAMQAGFASFRKEAQEQGWDVDKVLYQLPPSSSLVGSAK